MKSLFVIIFLIALNVVHAKKNGLNYTYVDGNNNTYEIYEDSLCYHPITKLNSSSGEYDGGEDKTVALNENLFLEIKSEINNLIKSKSEHVETRLMGCGTIMVGKKTYYINMNSQLKNEFEGFLKRIIEGKI